MRKATNSEISDALEKQIEDEHIHPDDRDEGKRYMARQMLFPATDIQPELDLG